MKRLTALVSVLHLVVFVAVVSAQSLPTAKPEQVGLSSERLERVSRVLRSEIESGKIPGAVALVARKGQIVYFESFGLRDKASGAPMSKDAIFRLYSMTKPFTSVAAMIWPEDGKVPHRRPRLEVPSPARQARGQRAAVRRGHRQGRLRHGAGRARDHHPGPAAPHLRLRLPRRSEHPGQRALRERRGRAGRDQTPEEQLDRLGKVPLAHQPGTTWEYSLSTDVLGRVVEKVSGMRLGRFFEERIFRPLKMTDTQLRGR